MKTLGIDYGSKYIGLAVSNDKGTISFAHKVILNSRKAVAEIKDIVQKEEIKQIVVGIPEYNKKNSFYKQVLMFISNLKNEISLPTHTIDELLSSELAKKQGLPAKNHEIAAQIILESFLEKSNKHHN